MAQDRRVELVASHLIFRADTGALRSAAGPLRSPSNALAVSIPMKVPQKVFQELQLVGNYSCR